MGGSTSEWPESSGELGSLVSRLLLRLTLLATPAGRKQKIQRCDDTFAIRLPQGKIAPHFVDKLCVGGILLVLHACFRIMCSLLQHRDNYVQGNVGYKKPLKTMPYKYSKLHSDWLGIRFHFPVNGIRKVLRNDFAINVIM